jgi:hypothetical protein
MLQHDDLLAKDDIFREERRRANGRLTAVRPGWF